MRLRPFTDGDCEPLLTWRNDPEVARWMYTDHVISPEEHGRWFERVRRDTTDQRHRILDADGVPVAMVSLTAIDAHGRSCTWGGYVVPGEGGRGRGTAALALSLQLAFDDLGLGRVWIEALAENDRAIRLYERMGFRRDPGFHEVIWQEGRPRDVVGLALSRSEWLDERTAIMEQVARPRSSG